MDHDVADRTPYALVVDDDASILVEAVKIVEGAGFYTLDAYDAEEALGRLEMHGEDITLLFTDVEMPGSIDGFELARLVSKRWPTVGILVASGRVKMQPGQMPNGAVFVAKPFSAEVVYDRIQELLPNGRRPEPLKQRS